jgi:predicted dehydrogenase
MRAVRAFSPGYDRGDSMASDRNDDNGISRRDFTTRLGAAAAGVMVGGDLLGGLAQAAPHTSSRILGANDRVVTASIGIHSQGNALKRGFAQLKNVEIKTLCDIDANLYPSRANDATVLAKVPTFKPGYVQDLRKVLDDKDIDAVVIAVPNHWHALASIWAMQAGKHVYVEKPASHTVWEGRRMVEAARHYNKIVQVGTMNRSRPAVIDAIKFMQGGGIGKVYMARGLCFKPRPNIGLYSDGSMQPSDPPFSFTVNGKGNDGPYTAEYLSKVDYNLWIGPAPVKPFNRNRFHYNWHWQWDYGNGDTGNQGPHQFDIARWGLGKQEHPVKVSSMGGYFGAQPTAQETPDMQTALFEYADGTILEFGTRGEHTPDEGGVRIGNLFFGTKGWLWIEESGRHWQSYMGPLGAKNEKGPGSSAPAPKEASEEPTGLTTTEFPHYQNFVDAIRANDPKVLTCEILEGHLSAALPHLANIAYLAKDTIVFDGKTETIKDNKKANDLLTREYRKGFEVPASFAAKTTAAR